MRTSIAEFLKKEGISPEHTVYGETDEDVLHYPIISGDFLTWIRKGDSYKSFELMHRFLEQFEAKKQGEAYACLRQTIEELKAFTMYLERVNREDPERRYQHLIKYIRMKRKRLEEMNGGLKEILKADVAEENFGTRELLSEKVICYKNKLCLTTFHDMSCFVEPLNGITHKLLRKTPLFTSSVIELQQAVREHEQSAGHAQSGGTIAVTGGPCLFGYDEVIMEIIHKSGENFYYDYSGKRNYESEDGIMDKERISEHIIRHKKEIAELQFIDKKKGITRGEYESLLYIFEFAKALKAKLFIPIPDISYKKFMSAICKELDEHIAERAESAFEQIVHRITELHLKQIACFKELYPDIDVEILHDKTEDLCAMFYREREKYNSSYIDKRLNNTANLHNKEPVIDYITMPALPFYRWGIRDVIHVDCISEIDSYRKCIKMHKDAFRLHGVFFPERLSSDGVYTIYSTDNHRKEYLYSN